MTTIELKASRNMNFVSAVTSKVDQLRGRLFLSRLNRSQKVFVHSFRLSVVNGQAVEKYRVCILVRADGFIEAESVAETHLQEIVRAYRDSSGGEVELKRFKPRELGTSAVDDESARTLQLLQKLRRESGQAVSAVEPIEIN